MMVRMMSPGLLRYLVGRLVRALLTVIGLVTIVFLLVRLIPGDPVEAILGDQAGPEEKAELRRALNLDRPVGEQYLSFRPTAAWAHHSGGPIDRCGR
jgi:peptide/nickel transport system permease protein